MQAAVVVILEEKAGTCLVSRPTAGAGQTHPSIDADRTGPVSDCNID